MCVICVCDLNDKISISGVKLKGKVTETKGTDEGHSWANILPCIYTSNTRRTDHPPSSSHTGSAGLKQMGFYLHNTKNPTFLTTFWRRELSNAAGLQWVNNSNMNLIWSICIICLAGCLTAARARPVRNIGKKNNTAPEEEVNVLMFGVIQFSDSLKYISETTKAKVDRIAQTLKNHEGTLQRLGRHAEEAAKIEKQIKAVVMLLQVSERRDM